MPDLGEVFRRTTGSVNEALLRDSISHAFYLSRLRETYVRDIVNYLDKEVFHSLLEQLSARIDITVGRGAWTTQRLKEMIQASRKVVQVGVDAAKDSLSSQFQTIAMREAEWQAAMLRGNMPRALNFDFRTPSPAFLKNVIAAHPFVGRQLGKYWTRLAPSISARVERLLKIGMTTGQTTPQIVNALNGTLKIAKHHAAAWTRTAITDVVSKSALKTYQENSDVIKGWQFVATLDARTTDVCMSYDGRVFLLNEGYSVTPPLHFQCRSFLAPVMKSLNELGIKGPMKRRLPPATRASMTGQVAQKMTRAQWLYSLKGTGPKGNRIIKDALGIRRGRRFIAGEIGIKDIDEFAVLKRASRPFGVKGRPRKKPAPTVGVAAPPKAKPPAKKPAKKAPAPPKAGPAQYPKNDFKTLAEVERWWKKHYPDNPFSFRGTIGKNTFGPKREYTSSKYGKMKAGTKVALDVKVANACARYLDDFYRQYPMMLNELKEVRAMTLTQIYKEYRAAKQLHGRSIDEFADVLGYAHPLKIDGKSAIRLSVHHLHEDLDRLVAVMKNDLAKGFHPAGAFGLQSTLVHETGHAIHHVVDRITRYAGFPGVKGKTWVKLASEKGMSKIERLKDLTRELMTMQGAYCKQISRYASPPYSCAEFFAELYTQCTMHKGLKPIGYTKALAEGEMLMTPAHEKMFELLDTLKSIKKDFSYYYADYAEGVVAHQSL